MGVFTRGPAGPRKSGCSKGFLSGLAPTASSPYPPPRRSGTEPGGGVAGPSGAKHMRPALAHTAMRRWCRARGPHGQSRARAGPHPRVSVPKLSWSPRVCRADVPVPPRTRGRGVPGRLTWALCWSAGSGPAPPCAPRTRAPAVAATLAWQIPAPKSRRGARLATGAVLTAESEGHPCVRPQGPGHVPAPRPGSRGVKAASRRGAHRGSLADEGHPQGPGPRAQPHGTEAAD